MSLDVKKLERQLIAVLGAPSPNKAISIKKFASAFNDYAKDLEPKSKNTEVKDKTKTSLAMDVFILDFGTKTTLTQMTGAPPIQITLQSALTKFAITVALGMTPPGIPPPGLINLVKVFAIGLAGGSKQAVAKAMAVEVDKWFRTGKIGTNNWK